MIKRKGNKISNIYVFSVACKIFLVFLSLITSALITRVLGVSAKGDYSYINNIANILVIIFSFGIGQTYSTFKRNNNGENNLNVFITLLVLHGLFMIVITIVAYLFNANFYIVMALLLTFGGVLRNNIVYIASIEDVKKRNICNMISKIIYAFLIFIVYIAKIKNLYLILFLLLIDELLLFFFLFYSYKFKFTILSIKKFGKKNLCKLYKLGLFSMLSLLLTLLNYNIDIIVLKHMSNSYNTGLYSIAVTIANMLWIIPDSFKDILFNKTSKSDSINEIVKCLKINLYIALVLIIGFIFLGKFFITILYGNEFIESFTTTIILLFGSLCMIIHKMISPLYISKGEQKTLLFIFFWSVCLNVILNILLIPTFNIIGAAIASVFSYTIVGLIILYKFVKEYNVKMKDIFILNQGDFKIFKSLILKVKR